MSIFSDTTLPTALTPLSVRAARDQCTWPTPARRLAREVWQRTAANAGSALAPRHRQPPQGSPQQAAPTSGQSWPCCRMRLLCASAQRPERVGALNLRSALAYSVSAQGPTLSYLPALTGATAPAFASAPMTSSSMLRVPGLCCMPCAAAAVRVSRLQPVARPERGRVGSAGQRRPGGGRAGRNMPGTRRPRTLGTGPPGEPCPSAARRPGRLQARRPPAAAAPWRRPAAAGRRPPAAAARRPGRPRWRLRHPHSMWYPHGQLPRCQCLPSSPYWTTGRRPGTGPSYTLATCLPRLQARHTGKCCQHSSVRCTQMQRLQAAAERALDCLHGASFASQGRPAKGPTVRRQLF